MSVGIAIPTAAPEFSSPHVCGSAGSYSFMSLRSKKPSKADVCQDFIQKLRDRRGIELEAPGLIDGIQQHFQQLPTRYALDVNIGSLDVLNHKRLLDSARQDPSAVSFQVRPVDVAPGLHGSANMDKRPSLGNLDSLTEVSSGLLLPSKLQSRSSCGCLGSDQRLMAPLQAASHHAQRIPKPGALPRPAFGSSPNLQVRAWLTHALLLA